MSEMSHWLDGNANIISFVGTSSLRAILAICSIRYHNGTNL